MGRLCSRCGTACRTSRSTPDRSPNAGIRAADAGEDLSSLVGSGASGPYVVNLKGIAEDDGLPNDNLTTTWSKVTGPGSANFDDVHDPGTNVSLSTDGTYQLCLTAGGGDKKTDYTPWLTFNHFPAAQILSDGRKAREPEHLTHSVLSEIDVDDLSYDIYMYGLTNSSASSLVPLSRSWNSPPSLSVGSSGLSNQGYDRGQRAYILQLTSPGAKTLQFTLNGSSGSPIVNPCFVIKSWQSKAKVSLAINGQPVAAGPNFRQGIENNASGAVPSLVVWIKKEATSPINITMTKEEIPGDFDGDCDVDEADLAALMSHWLDTQPGCQSLEGDLNNDCKVNFKDFAVLAQAWRSEPGDGRNP